MGSDPDADALSWSGETDPTHVAAPASAAPKKTAAKAGAAKAGAEEGAPQRTSSVALIVLGILAGVYLLYAVGWAIFGFTSGVPVQGAFFGVMYQVGVALAIASPFLWAIAVWLRVKSQAPRMLWLFVGVLVLAPWPFIMGGLG